MFGFVLLSAIATALLSGVPNDRSHTGNSSTLIVSGVADALHFQHPLSRTTRRRIVCSLDRTPPFVQKTSWAFSRSKPSSRRNRPSSTVVGATRIPSGDKSGAKDRKEDLKLTIETIMQFIDNTSNEVPTDGESPKQDVPKRRPPVDHKMKTKYEELALLVKKEVERTTLGQHQQINEGVNRSEQQQQQQPSSATWWCAIAGGPGAGKSTLAQRVAAICNDELGIPSIVVPMDGYFFSRSELETQLKLDPRGRIDYLRRRGSPHTINTEKLCEDLAVASGKRLQTDPFVGPFGNGGGGGGWGENDNEANLASQPSAFAFPSYRRTAPSDPLPKQIHFDPSHHRVVFVEGEYLLLGKGGMVPGYVTETESKRWKPLLPLFDATWFVTCQPEQQNGANDKDEEEDETQVWYNYDFKEQRKRRISYHLEEDEDDEETLQSLFPSFLSAGTKVGGGSTVPLSKDDVAAKRVDSNDVLNMLIAETSQQHASLVIRSI